MGKCSIDVSNCIVESVGVQSTELGKGCPATYHDLETRVPLQEHHSVSNCWGWLERSRCPDTSFSPRDVRIYDGSLHEEDIAYLSGLEPHLRALPLLFHSGRIPFLDVMWLVPSSADEMAKITADTLEDLKAGTQYKTRQLAYSHRPSLL